MEPEIRRYFRNRLEEQVAGAKQRARLTPEFIAAVVHANERLDDGSYGRCEECGAGLSLHTLYSNPTRCACCQCSPEPPGARMRG